uniref:NADH-ubiquinone oxidoreductase chain 6 n=1 Tax=Eumantispa harmandi TaxID=1593348 RepID=A0A1S5QYF6_9NEOP|nr:NADH dehydrogenase subunit 6 [Eumantispa harmandi]AMW67940.1 NADH dehydrogenase subunit 6 [Eumantispa harmandi]AYG51268.1 NADH dehydrogenase subunit 6 [Eumantispa harmandi]
MNQIILTLSFISSINFIKTNHPLAMGLNLMIQTILISILCGAMYMSYWFNYIMFLIMIGGMLVLFIYITSLASNELFNLSINNMISLMLIMLLIMMMFMNMDNFFFIKISSETDFMLNCLYNENSFNLIKLYNNNTMNITLWMIIYLLITLIIVVKITNINYGSLRKLN